MTNEKRILIADDEPDILEIIQYNLQQEGYEVFTARNGDDVRLSIANATWLQRGMAVAPTFLGRGLRLFEGIDAERIGLEVVRARELRADGESGAGELLRGETPRASPAVDEPARARVRDE